MTAHLLYLVYHLMLTSKTSYASVDAGYSAGASLLGEQIKN